MIVVVLSESVCFIDEAIQAETSGIVQHELMHASGTSMVTIYLRWPYFKGDLLINICFRERLLKKKPFRQSTNFYFLGSEAWLRLIWWSVSDWITMNSLNKRLRTITGLKTWLISNLLWTWKRSHWSPLQDSAMNSLIWIGMTMSRSTGIISIKVLETLTFVERCCKLGILFTNFPLLSLSPDSLCTWSRPVPAIHPHQRIWRTLQLGFRSSLRDVWLCHWHECVEHQAQTKVQQKKDRPTQGAQSPGHPQYQQNVQVQPEKIRCQVCPVRGNS